MENALDSSPCRKCGAALVPGAGYCHACGTSTSSGPDAELPRRVAQLEDRLKRLTDVVDQHADVVNGQAAQVTAMENRLNSSSLFSDSFWTRAWAVVGHNLSVGLLVYLVLFVVAIMLAGLG